MTRILLLALLMVGPAAHAIAQSATGAILGHVVAAADGKLLGGVVVSYKNVQTNSTSLVVTDSNGIYGFPVLLPGHYEVTAAARRYRPQTRTDLEITVSARLEVIFALEPLPGTTAPGPVTPPPSLAGGKTAGGVLALVYGADAQPQTMLISIPTQITETLVGDLSTVIDERKILELPYSGRDVYTLLILQPGVSSDNATGKGLGLAVNGQRVAGTNFLLDGVDNNDLLLTGPSAKVSADAVQEYRMVTNNFSAEFGRATAFIANAITRSGSNALHGSAFEFFNHDRLNANSFANNTNGLPRATYKQNQFGGSAGGPIRRDRLFFFGSFERAYAYSRSFDQTFFVPSRTFIARLKDGSIAKRLLTQFQPPAGVPVAGFPDAEAISFHYPLRQRNTLLLGRLDYGAPGGRDRLSGRYAFSQSTDVDFLPSIYPDLTEPLVTRSQNVALNYTRTLRSSTVNELKFGYNRGRVGFNRPHPEIPTLHFNFDPIVLPGSEAPYAYSYQDKVLHVVDNLSSQRGKHSLVAGLEWRRNTNDSVLAVARDGLYTFNYLSDFAADDPTQLNITVDRFTGKALDPSAYIRVYHQTEMAAFLQDNWKVTSRLTVNVGVRYEYFGVPARADGPTDWNLFYGPGNNRTERLATATLKQAPPYSPDRNNFAPRFGFAWDLRGHGKTVLRGGYGISYDRIFNNIWLDVRNNSLAYTTLAKDRFTGRRNFSYTIPAIAGLPPTSPDFGSEVTFQVDQTLRTPYGQSWFIGVQQQITGNLVVEIDHAGSLGRELLALDEINRTFSLPLSSGNNGRIIPNPNIGAVSYRGNQGASDYVALQASARQRLSHGLQFQVSYTFSRNRDNQSDPFRNPVNVSGVGANRLGDPNLFAFPLPHATFTQQFNSSLDRGLSDFDQTHNLVFNLIAESQSHRVLLRRWQLSVLAGFRSGFPYSVLATGLAYSSDFGILNRNRANLVGGGTESAYLASPRQGPGGFYLLDRSKFTDPPDNKIGSVPRNAFRGPGFWNADFGVSRSFPMRWLGEQGRLQFRTEFFNLMNHTNLGNPDSAIGSGTFGLAKFGRQGFSGSLPSVSPLNEQPRRIELGLKFYF